MGVDDFVFPPMPENTILGADESPLRPTGAFYTQMLFYFKELINESNREDQLQAATINSLASLIMILILRIREYYTAQPASTDTPYSKQMKEFIDRNYSSDINLDSLAESAYISKTYACRVFKDSYGVSPIDYLITRRIEMAKHLLANTDLSITQIAKRVGYADAVYFSQIFKQRAEVSPSAFRRNKAGSADETKGKNRL